jgi:hypothetical protein
MSRVMLEDGACIGGQQTGEGDWLRSSDKTVLPDSTGNWWPLRNENNGIVG